MWMTLSFIFVVPLFPQYGSGFRPFLGFAVPPSPRSRVGIREVRPLPEVCQHRHQPLLGLYQVYGSWFVACVKWKYSRKQVLPRQDRHHRGEGSLIRMEFTGKQRCTSEGRLLAQIQTASPHSMPYFPLQCILLNWASWSLGATGQLSYLINALQIEGVLAAPPLGGCAQ